MGEGPTPVQGSWETPPTFTDSPVHGGEQEECQLHTKENPPPLTSQPGTEHSPFRVHHFQSSSQQPSKLETVFIISILQMKKLRLGEPSSLPKDAHCHQSHLLELDNIIPPPRGWLTEGDSGGMRTDVLGGHSGPALFFPKSVPGRIGLSMSLQLSTSSCPLQTHTHQCRKAGPYPCHTHHFPPDPSPGLPAAPQCPGAPSLAPHHQRAPPQN